MAFNQHVPGVRNGTRTVSTNRLILHPGIGPRVGAAHLTSNMADLAVQKTQKSGRRSYQSLGRPDRYLEELCKTDDSDTVRRVPFRTMTTAANASTKVLKKLMHPSSERMTKLPFPLVHHILTFAVSHLINATSSDDRLRRTSANGLRTFLKVLDLLKGTWQARASRAIAAIQELSSRWRIVNVLPINFSEPLEGQVPYTDERRRNQDDFSLQGLGEYGNLDELALPLCDFSAPDMFAIEGIGCIRDHHTWQENGLCECNWICSEHGRHQHGISPIRDISLVEKILTLAPTTFSFFLDALSSAQPTTTTDIRVEPWHVTAS
jgi:hypothetical protein